MLIRPEDPTDAPAIASLIEQAFAGAPHADGSEAGIVDALRAAGALAVSLVAEADGALAGHVALSAVTIGTTGDGTAHWYGLGPIAVAPDLQRQGIGSHLVRAGLARLAELGAAGCVVLGDPAYYRRFGFAVQPGLLLPGVPAGHFMALPFGPVRPQGAVAYHAAFTAAG